MAGPLPFSPSPRPGTPVCAPVRAAAPSARAIYRCAHAQKCMPKMKKTSCVSILTTYVGIVYLLDRGLASGGLYPQPTILDWGALRHERYHSGPRAMLPTTLRLHRPVLRWPMPAPHRRSNASQKLLEGTRLLLGVRSRVGEPGPILRAGRVCHRRTDRRVRRRVGGRQRRGPACESNGTARNARVGMDL